MMYKDDDWYKEAPEWLKSTHWLLKFGDTVIRIPKATDVGIRFVSNAMEVAMNNAYNKNPHKFMQYFEPVKEGLPGLFPTALLPSTEILANHSFFTDRPIIPQAQQKLPAKLQYGPYTTSFAKWVGETFDVAPRNVEHFMSGHGGTLAFFLPKVYDLMAGNQPLSLALEDLPFTRGFLYPEFKSPTTVNKLYEELDQQTKLNNEYKLTNKRPDGLDTAKLKRLDKARREISDLNKKEKSIIDNPRWTIEKRKMMQRNIEKEKIQIAKRAMGIH